MENFRKEVDVRVTTIQKDLNGKDTIDVKYKGNLFFKNGEYLLFYDEYDEENQKTGEFRIKVTDDFVEIRRFGGYASKMVFQKGKPFRSIYKTPYGEMEMLIKTISLVKALDADGGKLMIEYDMNLNSQAFHNNVTVRIDIRKD